MNSFCICEVCRISATQLHSSRCICKRRCMSKAQDSETTTHFPLSVEKNNKEGLRVKSAFLPTWEAAARSASCRFRSSAEVFWRTTSFTALSCSACSLFRSACSSARVNSAAFSFSCRPCNVRCAASLSPSAAANFCAASSLAAAACCHMLNTQKWSTNVLKPTDQAMLQRTICKAE